MRSRISQPGRAPQPGSQRGIALMLVLWVVALLTIIAIGMTATQRTESTLAANQLGSAHFRAQADAAINYAAFRLMAQPSLDGEDSDELWIPDGTPRGWVFAGDSLEITLYNEASLIDLNVASRDLLIGLFAAVGVDESEQDSLADAVLDWRDENDLHLLNGAEDGDYDDAGLPYGAKDGPFDSVEELRQVLGFDRALYRALAPALTVWAGARRIAEDLAPPLVLAALQGITLEEMELQLEEEALLSPSPGDLVAVNRGGPLYRILVRRESADGSALSMQALMKVQQAGATPVQVLWRRYGLALNPAVDLSAADQAAE